MSKISIGNISRGKYLNDDSTFEPSENVGLTAQFLEDTSAGEIADDPGGGADGSTLPSVAGEEGSSAYVSIWGDGDIQCYNLEQGAKARWQSVGAKGILDGISAIKSIPLLGGLVEAALATQPTGYQGGGGTSGGSGGGTNTVFPPGTVINPAQGYNKTLPKAYSGTGTNPDGLGFGANRGHGGVGGGHNGIDLMMAEGTPYLSPFDGVIHSVGYNDTGLGGRYVKITSADGVYTVYGCHLKSIASGITPGTAVKAGQVVGYIGHTGNASPGADHLHFEVRVNPGYSTNFKTYKYKDRVYVDPTVWLQGATIVP